MIAGIPKPIVYNGRILSFGIVELIADNGNRGPSKPKSKSKAYYSLLLLLAIFRYQPGYLYLQMTWGVQIISRAITARQWRLNAARRNRAHIDAPWRFRTTKAVEPFLSTARPRSMTMVEYFTLMGQCLSSPWEQESSPAQQLIRPASQALSGHPVALQSRARGNQRNRNQLYSYYIKLRLWALL